MFETDLLDVTQERDVMIVSFVIPSITGGCGIEKIGENLLSFLTKNKPSKIIVDFDGVKFFSSVMLGILVDVWKHQSQYGGKMIISGIDPQLSRVFKVTNLDKIFDFSPSRAAALARLEASDC